MLSASGSYVKVYLFLAKCIQAGEDDISISFLADRMESTEKDIVRALAYWEKNGLLRLLREFDTDKIVGIEMLDPKNGKSAAPQDSPSDRRDDKKNGEKPTEPSAVDIVVTPEQTQRLSEDEEFVWTCRVIENYVNRPLNSKEASLISYLYDSLGFSSELLLYLYEYCISLGKTNVNYIQAVALSWNEKNIKNSDDAKKYVSGYNSAYTAISKAFALGRPLAVIEKQYVDRWQNEWHIDLSVILDACSRTMLKLQKADFKYAEGILCNWHKSGIHTLMDVEKADRQYAQKKNDARRSAPKGGRKGADSFNSYRQRDSSEAELDELEKKLLARSNNNGDI